MTEAKDAVKLLHDLINRTRRLLTVTNRDEAKALLEWVDTPGSLTVPAAMLVDFYATKLKGPTDKKYKVVGFKVSSTHFYDLETEIKMTVTHGETEQQLFDRLGATLGIPGYRFEYFSMDYPKAFVPDGGDDAYETIGDRERVSVFYNSYSLQSATSSQLVSKYYLRVTDRLTGDPRSVYINAERTFAELASSLNAQIYLNEQEMTTSTLPVLSTLAEQKQRVQLSYLQVTSSPVNVKLYQLNRLLEETEYLEDIANPSRAAKLLKWFSDEKNITELAQVLREVYVSKSQPPADDKDKVVTFYLNDVGDPTSQAQLKLEIIHGHTTEQVIDVIADYLKIPAWRIQYIQGITRLSKGDDVYDGTASSASILYDSYTLPTGSVAYGLEFEDSSGRLHDVHVKATDTFYNVKQNLNASAVYLDDADTRYMIGTVLEVLRSRKTRPRLSWRGR